MSWLTEDRARLDRFRQGDPDTLAEVYDHYGLPLSKMLARGFSFSSQGKSMHFSGRMEPYDLDDILQETFIRAFADRARQSYDGLRPFNSFLLAIAKNLLIDRHRGATRWSAVVQPMQGSDDDAEDPHPQTRPDHSAIDAQLVDIYRDFLQGLDETAQTVCRLRFEEHLTRRQVQEHTGLSSMRLRSLEERLRQKLCRRLVSAGYRQSEVLLWLLVFMTPTWEVS